MYEYDISTILSPERSYTFRNCMYQRWQAQSFSYREKPRPDHGLLYVLTGKIRFEFSGGFLTASCGDVIFLPKYSYYEAVMLPEYGETKDYLINFDSAESVDISVPVKLLHTTEQWYPELCQRMLEKKLAGEPRPLWFNGQLYLLLDLLDRLLHGAVSEREERMQKIRQLLTDAPQMTVAEIAKVCGISESSLRSQFEKAYQCSPRQYRTDAKLRKAKFLLESTDLTVSDIALKLQYYDEAYFCKCFRACVGCTPNQYRRKKEL